MQFGWEFALLDGIQAVFGSAWGDWFWPVYTHLGSGGILWIALILWVLLVKKEKKRGIIAILALLLCLVIGNGLLKNLVQRPRPFSYLPNLTLLIAPPQDYSFPSGHTMSSFAAAYALSLGQSTRKKVLLYVLAAAMAFSRLYLYVHFPTDILAGVVLGLAMGVLAKKVVYDAEKKRQAHKLDQKE